MTGSHSPGVKIEPSNERKENGPCSLPIWPVSKVHCQRPEDPAGGGAVGREPPEQACQPLPLVSEYSNLLQETVEFGLDLTTVLISWASGLEG